MADTRAKKAGIGAAIDKKLELRYDQEEETGTTKAIQIWLNAVLSIQKIPEILNTLGITRYMHPHKHILINILLETEKKSKVHFQSKVKTMFVAYTNIENYNKGCLEYGLAKEFTVQSADLWEGRKGPFLNVINNLHSLGFLANSKQFSPTYTGEIQKTLDFE